MFVNIQKWYSDKTEDEGGLYIQGKDEELLKHSHTKYIKLPTGIIAKVVISRFKQDERSYHRIGDCNNVTRNKFWKEWYE